MSVIKLSSVYKALEGQVATVARFCHTRQQWLPIRNIIYLLQLSLSKAIFHGTK